MDVFFELGFSEDNVKDILSFINIIDSNDILFKINILKNIGCKSRHIKNILLTNIGYLNRSNSDILNLINRLYELGFNTLYILFDSNPFILNKDVYEIDNYIKDKLNNGVVLSDIVSYLDSNPYIFDIM